MLHVWVHQQRNIWFLHLDFAAGGRRKGVEHQQKLQLIQGHQAPAKATVDDEASDRDTIVAIKQFKTLGDMEDAYVRDYVRRSQVEALFKDPFAAKKSNYIASTTA